MGDVFSFVCAVVGIIYAAISRSKDESAGFGIVIAIIAIILYCGERLAQQYKEVGPENKFSEENAENFSSGVKACIFLTAIVGIAAGLLAVFDISLIISIIGGISIVIGGYVELKILDGYNK